MISSAFLAWAAWVLANYSIEPAISRMEAEMLVWFLDWGLSAMDEVVGGLLLGCNSNVVVAGGLLLGCKD